MLASRAPSFGEPIKITGRDGPWEPVRTDLRDRGVALLFARLADWRPDQAGRPRLRALLGRDWARYLDLTHPDIRQRFAASRVLLKFAAAAALDVPADNVELSYGPSGRPYLRGFDGVDISLSHTEDLLLVGLTTRGLIGVDAERVGRTLYGAGLASHLCTAHELELVEALPEAGRDPALVRLWTLKEAYSKAIGQGMLFRFTEFGFGLDAGLGGGSTGVRRPDGSPGTGAEWHFATFYLEDEYVVSASVGDSGFRTTDTTAETALEPSFVAALTEALGADEAEAGDGADPW